MCRLHPGPFDIVGIGGKLVKLTEFVVEWVAVLLHRPLSYCVGQFVPSMSLVPAHLLDVYLPT